MQAIFNEGYPFRLPLPAGPLGLGINGLLQGVIAFPVTKRIDANPA